MPWEPQICPFCQTQYANKKALQTHLHKYVGKWRYPADGIHDVLKIKTLNIMKKCLSEEDKKPSYQCPSCARVVIDRRKFVEHVVCHRHYGHSKGDASNSSQPTSFDPEPYKIWQPKGTFPFLRLPLELRELIYKTILCFDRIEVYNAQIIPVNPIKGVWMQHNPPNNLLAILAASRQVYHEARRIFYRYNTFWFNDTDAIPVFLIGIGRANALLLKSIKWDYENHIDMVKSYITQKPTTKEQHPQQKEVNIYNDEDLFVSFTRKLMSQEERTFSRTTKRLLRLDSEDVSVKDFRLRYNLKVLLYEHGDGVRKCVAGYELSAHWVRDDPVPSAALQARMRQR